MENNPNNNPITLEKAKETLNEIPKCARSVHWLQCIICLDAITFRCNREYSENENVILYVNCCGRLMHKNCIINTINAKRYIVVCNFLNFYCKKLKIFI